MRLSLRNSILVGIGVAMLFSIGAGVFGLYQSYKASIHISESAESAAAVIRKVNATEKLFAEMVQEWKNTLLRGSQLDAFEKHSRAFDKSVSEIYVKVDDIKDEVNPSGQALLGTFVANLQSLEKKYKQARSEFINENRFEPANADKAVKGLDRGVVESLVSLSEEIQKELKEKHDQALADLRWNFQMTVGSALLVGLVSLFLISAFVSRKINIITNVIKSLDEASTHMSGAAVQMSSTSVELSQSTTKQASSLEETAASVEEISSMIAKSADHAKNAAQVSTESQETANKGKESVKEMINSMHEISVSNEQIMNQMNHSNAQLSEIVKLITEIGNRTKVIDDIVFQTKLLSFNASVEAARAGEHGKGFAVVAEEVGNLASMSGSAAKEINAMLADSIKKVESIVYESKSKVESLVATGKVKVDSGIQVANLCSEALESIVEKVTNVSSMANEISVASLEQSTGVKEISKAVSQLDQVTQSNASMSHQTASVATELTTQSESLRSLVNLLTSTVTGRQGSAASPAPRVYKPAETPVQVSNVTPIRKFVADPVNKASFKKVSGDSVPHSEDPGFKDV